MQAAPVQGAGQDWPRQGQAIGFPKSVPSTATGDAQRGKCVALARTVERHKSQLGGKGGL